MDTASAIINELETIIVLYGIELHKTQMIWLATPFAEEGKGVVSLSLVSCPASHASNVRSMGGRAPHVLPD